jgi:hypothetical protein
MTWRSDDLASVMVASTGQFAGFTQGIIKNWDPDTFENTVTFDGSDHHDLAVTSGVEALTYTPGDVVVLTRWTPSGRGTATYAIAGRWLTPAAGRAEESIAFLRTSLARTIVDDLVSELLVSPAGVDLAKFVNAQLIKSATELGQTTTSSTTFGDGTAAGPTVTDVEVSSTGQCLVLWGASLGAGPITDNGQIGANMSIEVSGASSSAASLARSYHLGQSVTVAGATSWSHRASGRSLAGHLYTGLNAGTHTITAKYATQSGGETVTFSNRLIMVIAY